MQTLTQNLLFVATSDTTTAIYRDDVIVGSIMFDMEHMRWEYRNHANYDAPQTGDYDVLVAISKQDLTEFPPVRILKKGGISKPSNSYTGYRRISANRVQRITYGTDTWQDSIWVDLSYANKLTIGTVVEPHRPDGPCGKVFLRTVASRPVLRQLAA